MTKLSVKNLGSLFQRAAQKHPDKRAYRVPNGPKSYTEHTYSQAWEEVFKYARALHAAGAKRGDKLVILADTSFAWAITDWAAQTLGLITVPIYPTLPPDQAQYIVQDCGANIAICQDSKQAEKLTETKILLLEEEERHQSLLSLEKDSALTKEDWEAGIQIPESEDLATIIYTSGTTGNPKGVMLPHRNFIFLSDNIHDSLPIESDDIFLSWLPLSHVFERYAGHVLPVAVGAEIVYSRGMTAIAQELRNVKPSIVLCVPRFLESVRARIIDSVKKEGGFKEKLFNWALAQGLAKQQGKSAPFAGLLDSLVGKKIRERTGGNIKFFVSGGAALNPTIAEFYMAFGLKVLQGYGLTETCAATAINHPDDNNPQTVGPPIQGVEISIAPDGEILQRGPAVMTGYYNLPEDTAQAIDAEGWFHTGDIGELTEGKLRITDRKKDILVLANGKNVAPQPVENKFKESPYIGEVVILGDGKEFCSALIVPDFEAVTTWLKSKGETPPASTEQFISRQDVITLFRSEVKAINAELADYERAKRHVLLPKPFSVDDGELTPSLKVKRKVVKEKYATQIDQLK